MGSEPPSVIFYATLRSVQCQDTPRKSFGWSFAVWGNKKLFSCYFSPIHRLFLCTCVLLHTPTDGTAWIFIPKSYNTAGNRTHMSRVAPFICGLSRDTLRSNLPWTQLRKITNWNLLMLNLFRLLLPRVSDWRWTRTRGLEVPGRCCAGGRDLRTHRSLPVLVLPPTSPGFVHLRPRYSCLGECRLFRLQVCFPTKNDQFKLNSTSMALHLQLSDYSRAISFIKFMTPTTQKVLDPSGKEELNRDFKPK